MPNRIETLQKILDQGDGLEVPESLKPRKTYYFWFWFIVLATGIELGRKLHKSWYATTVWEIERSLDDVASAIRRKTECIALSHSPSQHVR